MKQIITIPFILICFLSQAQLAEKEKYINIKFNINAHPLGDFGSTSINNDDAGFARDGAGIEVGFTKYLHKYFGVGGNIGWRNNPVNVEAVGKELQKDNNINVSEVEAGSYGMTYIMANGYAGIPLIKNKLRPYVKFGPGIGLAKHGRMEVSTHNGNTIEGTSDQSAAFLINGGLGLKFQFGLFGMGLDYNMMYAKPGFDIETTVNGEDDGTSSFKLPMSTGNFNIMFTFQF